MVVYADVLVCFNAVVTYIFLVCTRVFCKYPTSKAGVVLSSAFGGASSLVVFLPPLNGILSLLLKMPLCSVIVFLAFFPKNIKSFIKLTLSFFGVSCVFGGGVYGVQLLLNSNRVIYKNGVAYLDVDIKFIVAGVFIIYGVFLLFDYFMRRCDIKGGIKSVEITYRDISIVLKGFFDTGNSLVDGISGRNVIVAQLQALSPIFTYEEICFLRSGEVDNVPKSLYGKVRFLPCDTVGGKALLPMITPDYIKVEGKVCKKTSVAIVDKSLSDGEYTVLLNNNMME